MITRAGRTSFGIPAILFIGFIIFSVQASAQEQNTWTVTVVKAQNLKNRDWGARRLSDPYVKVRGLINNESRIWKTRVIKDSLSPVWNESHTLTDASTGDTIPWLDFWIYDEDPLKEVPLGWVKMESVREGDYHLSLRNQLTNMGMPGMLTVSIRHVVHQKVTVPKLVGLTESEAKNALHRKGFKITRQIVYTLARAPDEGKIFAQNPSAGTRVEKGANLMILVHVAQTRIMPRIVGHSEKEAKELLSFLLRGPNIQHQLGLDSKNQEKWYRIVAQSVPAGKQITLDTPVTLSITVPNPGTRVEMPDLKGLKTNDAQQEMANRYLQFTWETRESSQGENGTVVDQQPEPGTKVPFDNKKGITVYVGHYSDGLSYFSTKPVNIGENVNLFFKIPHTVQYRRIQVEKPGYLILRKINAPFSVKCDFFTSGSPNRLGRNGRFFDQAIRVTKGQWVFCVYPEFNEDTSAQPVSIKVDFVPEFDLAEPNDSFESATELNPDAHLKVGFIGTSDRDFYRFDVKQPIYLLVRDDGILGTSKQMKLNPQMKLFNASREEIYSGPINLGKWLPKGSYFFDFYCEGSGENFDTASYGIDVRLLPDQDKTEPNDTPLQATRVEVPKSLEICYETRGNDYYHLTSKTPGYVLVSQTEKLSSPVKLWVLSPGGTESRARFLPCAVRIDKDLTVRLAMEFNEHYRVERTTTLNFLFIPGTQDPLEPNETLAQARPVPVNKDIEALSLPAKDIDTYRFRLQKPDSITLEVTDKPEKCVLQAKLYDGAGRPMAQNPIYLPQQFNLPAGEYLVQVFQENGLENMYINPYHFRVRTESGASAEDKINERYQDKNQSDTPSQRGIDLAKQAYMLYLKGEYQKSAGLYHEAARLIPECAALWNDLGACEFNLGHHDASSEDFNKAVLLKPDYALAWRNLGVLARKKGDHVKSMAYSEKAAVLDASAKNLRYAGYACLVAGSVEKNQNLKNQLWTKSAKFFEKSLTLEKNLQVAERLKLLNQYLAEHL